jgi:hypothetical protein
MIVHQPEGKKKEHAAGVMTSTMWDQMLVVAHVIVAHVIVTHVIVAHLIVAHVHDTKSHQRQPDCLF